MEKIKDPAMLLAVANSIGLVGTTAYFYKQMEAMRLDMAKISQTLSGVIRKMGEIEKTDQHKTEALHALNDQIKDINNLLEGMPVPDMVDNLDQDIEEIITTLVENNITIERPSQIVKPSRYDERRSNSRRDTNREEKREKNRRQPTRAIDSKSRVHSRDSMRDSTRDSMRDSTRDSMRDSTKEQVREPIRNNRVEAVTYDEDVDDLIGEVRRQQH